MKHGILTWIGEIGIFLVIPPDDRRVHPAADMGRLPAYPAIPGKADYLIAVMRMLCALCRLRISSCCGYGSAAVASAALQAGCIPVATVSVAVHDMLRLLWHIPARLRLRWHLSGLQLCHALLWRGFIHQVRTGCPCSSPFLLLHHLVNRLLVLGLVA